MALDTYNRYTGTGRPFNDMGETTPEIEVSESVRPWASSYPLPTYLLVVSMCISVRMLYSPWVLP